MRAFGKPGEALRWLRDMFADWEGSLSDEERAVAIRYKRDRVAAGSLNAALRSGATLSEQDRRTAVLLDAAIRKAQPLNSPTIVWRGVQKAPAPWQRLQPGDFVRDPGFVSASMARHVAAVGYGGASPGGLLMEITLPAGIHAAPLELLQAEGEAELLLPRDSVFEVTGVEELPNGARLLEVTYVR